MIKYVGESSLKKDFFRLTAWPPQRTRRRRSTTGMWGHCSDCTPVRSRAGCWCSAHFFLLIRSETPTNRSALPNLGLASHLRSPNRVAPLQIFPEVYLLGNPGPCQDDSTAYLCSILLQGCTVLPAGLVDEASKCVLHIHSIVGSILPCHPETNSIRLWLHHIDKKSAVIFCLE